MKYRQLVEFQPIESVIQLTDADSPDKARKLVETFVVSESMGRQLTDLGFPNLQYEKPADNKGILLVANYGTGKSHLLSFLSAIAELDDAVKLVKNQDVAEAARSIAGKFKVVRTEIGATKKSLRNILCAEVEEHLDGMGVRFKFPAEDEITNNKVALIEMMGTFSERYPERGLLLIVDELLDYLKTRKEHELILDLNFLREVGEVCQGSRFRFIAGLQESLFDSPRFQFVAASLSRVKDRFQQMRIARQDVAYVVAERLLTKTAEQKSWVRSHLQKFTPLYGTMAERMEEFVRLFPVHPAYLETFEMISIAEKREILKTLSAEMRKRLDLDVPDDQPGLICFDWYWSILRDNASIRALPEVREVIDKSRVLESRVENAFTRPAYRAMAIRIIHGLSVHRLTNDDIYAKLGPTVEELRDGLCLYQPGMPERTCEFLVSQVETCLREIVKTMNGQFISRNDENGQHFLDLKKDIDHDAKIEEKSDTLSDELLDRYYFDALKRVIKEEVSPYITGRNIWQHELEWRAHKVTRLGYLFFGAPNDRPTAQPPRDFYLYFLQPFEPPDYDDEQRPEEVFFDLKERDEPFLKNLKLYAGAREMASGASSATRQVYEGKAGDYLKKLVEWLRQNMMTSFLVTHQGVSKKLVEWLKGQKTGNIAVGDMVDLVGSVCLASCFEDRYPEFPSFDVKLTTSNLPQAVEDAIRWLSGGLKSHPATAVLGGLELIDGERVRPEQSRYARAILTRLQAKPPNQVLNRKEIVSERNGVEFESQYRLEPELLVVVLLALVQSGHVTLSAAGKRFDAANLGETARVTVEQLCQFKHVERPKDLPLAELLALFDLLGLPEGLIRNPDTRDAAVTELRSRASQVIERAVLAKQQIQGGLACLGGDLLPQERRDEYRLSLDLLQTFLERLQAFNSPAKLKNFSSGSEEIASQREGLDALKGIEEATALARELSPIGSYLANAEAILPQGDSWRNEMEIARTEWRQRLLDVEARSAPDFRAKIMRALQEAKDHYKVHYLKLHNKARIGVDEDTKKKRLLNDPRLANLKKLAGISILSYGSLTELTNRLTGLKSCFSQGSDDLNDAPICPHCNFRPLEEGHGASGGAMLDRIDDELDTLTEKWTRTLLETLDDPTVGGSLELLPRNQRAAVLEFLESRLLPEKIGNELVKGIEAALSGLTAIPITAPGLLEALGGGGAPYTIEQFRSRFEAFLEGIVRGKNPAQVRIVIEAGVNDQEGGRPFSEPTQDKPAAVRRRDHDRDDHLTMPSSAGES